MTRPIDTTDARRSEIRAGLEDARTAFQDLLMSLAREDLGSRSSRSDWTVFEAAVHVVASLERTPALIAALRRDKDYMNVPMPVAEPAKRLITWSLARFATREALARRFDAAHAAIVVVLATIGDDEWARSGRAYGEGTWSVEHAFRHQAEHVHEHIHQIRLAQQAR
jgi:hypothetical protein